LSFTRGGFDGRRLKILAVRSPPSVRGEAAGMNHLDSIRCDGLTRGGTFFEFFLLTSIVIRSRLSGVCWGVSGLEVMRYLKGGVFT